MTGRNARASNYVEIDGRWMRKTELLEKVYRYCRPRIWEPQQ